jgi:glutathione synthase
MAVEQGVVTAKVARITLTGDSSDWYRAAEPAETNLGEFDAIMQRKDPPFDMEYVYGTYLLELAEKQGAGVQQAVRHPRPQREAVDCPVQPVHLADLVTSDEQRIRAFQKQHGDIILKPLDGMGGAGIFRVTADGMNLGSIIETLTHNGTQTIMVQRYIPDIVKGDKRILVIGGKPVPFALARIPQNGEVRGNLAAGGVGVAQPLTERDFEIANTLGPILAARGLLLVGLDVIGDY